MKSVLISIQPKWVEKIASGEKTIDVRKTRPKIETPFKCYIYCTKDKKREIFGGGKIIGEFVCDNILEWKYLNGLNDENEKEYWILSKDGHATCLTYDEIENYGKGKTLYGWHISDLKIYDKPKELSEFEFPKDNIYLSYRKRNQYFKGITRPPQSWCYVEADK